MMAQIEIKKTKDFPEAEFEVTVLGKTITRHRVTLSRDYYRKLTAGKVPPEKLMEESFEFLLAREPNTSILTRFDLAVISNYFPDYEREIGSKFLS